MMKMIPALALWLLPLAPSLTPGEQQYLNDIQANGVAIKDQASVVRLGHETCDLAADGTSRTSLVRLIAFAHPEFSQSQDDITVDAPFADLCPGLRVKP
jgi:hypothetical protein